MSPLPHEDRNCFTNPDANPEIGSRAFLACLVAAVALGFLLVAAVQWAKTW
jgi:hypothetical protein